MSESKVAVGAVVTFKSGRSGTEFKGTVDRFEGQFAVTKDADGKERKVRPGACTVVA